jgi:hypothetical protein
MKNKGLYIILFSLMSLISACDLFTENEFEKLYPNEYNSSDEMTGKWILALSPFGPIDDYKEYDIRNIDDSNSFDKEYFIGVEMENGRIVDGSICNIYRLDSSLIFQGTIKQFNHEGEVNDPLSFLLQTSSSPGIDKSRNEVLYYKLVGNICKFKKDGTKESCFELDSIYSSIGSVASIYKSVKNYSQSTLDLYNTGVQTNYFDSLKTHMGLLGRTKNSEYLNGVIEIINSIGSQQRSTYSSQENGSNNSPSSSSKKFNIVVEYTPSNNNEYPEGVTVANCQWCSETFGYVGDFAAMSFDFAKYRHLNLGGFRITENRYGCRVETGTTYCSKRCASKACDADFR